MAVVASLVLVFGVLGVEGARLFSAAFMKLLSILGVGQLLQHEFLVLFDVIAASLQLIL